MLYRVKTKTSLMNLKLKPEVHQEFRVAAELRGLTMSGLLHQFIVQTIWEEKKKHPEAFGATPSNLEADIRAIQEGGGTKVKVELKRKAS